MRHLSHLACQTILEYFDAEVLLRLDSPKKAARALAFVDPSRSLQPSRANPK